MSKRHRNAQYFFLGSFGNVQSDRDTGSERHEFRYEIGNYMTSENVKTAQREFFKERFPNLSDKQIDNKIRKAEMLAGN